MSKTERSGKAAPAVGFPVERMVRPLVQRLREGAAPLDDPDLNDEAADRIELLSWALTDVLKVATSWNLFSTTTIDRKPSSTTMRLRAAAAALKGPKRFGQRPALADPMHIRLCSAMVENNWRFEMSLYVYLEDEHGKVLYSRNITHNLGDMAGEAGIYQCLWRPDENGITSARQIIEPLAAGITLLATQKSRFEALNSANGWGMWDHFLSFCADYLQACRDHPDSLVRACR